jgi:hypothetical protein
MMPKLEKNPQQEGKCKKIRINNSLYGPAVKWAGEIKELAIAISNLDLFNEAIKVFYNSLKKRRLKSCKA